MNYKLTSNRLVQLHKVLQDQLQHDTKDKQLNDQQLRKVISISLYKR